MAWVFGEPRISYAEESLLGLIRSDFKVVLVSSFLTREAQWVADGIVSGAIRTRSDGRKEREERFAYCQSYREYILVDELPRNEAPCAFVGRRLRTLDEWVKGTSADRAVLAGVSVLVLESRRVVAVVLMADGDQTRVLALARKLAVDVRGDPATFDAGVFIAHVKAFREGLGLPELRASTALDEIARSLREGLLETSPEWAGRAGEIVGALARGRAVVARAAPGQGGIAACLANRHVVDILLSPESEIAVDIVAGEPGECFLLLLTRRVETTRSMVAPMAPLVMDGDSDDTDDMGDDDGPLMLPMPGLRAPGPVDMSAFSDDD